jgi:hypothetical protein
MKAIRINGHIIDGALLADDPDVKKTFVDASGTLRHVRSFSNPGRLKAYVRRHPEGIILAGAGNIFFTEPVPVSPAMISFDENGSANIQVREGAAELERQLEAIEAIQTAAENAILR